MDKRRGIVWFRNDLRIHDNEALTEALAVCDEVLLVYIFDDRVFKAQTPYGFPKTGSIRCQFVIESVQALRQKIHEEYNGGLIVRSGKTEEILFKLAHQYKTNWIFCNRERTKEEVAMQDAVEDQLWSIGQELRYSRGKMLLYTADLPFPVTHTPEQFSTFKKEVLYVPIRLPLATPDNMSFVKLIDDEIGEIPGLKFFGLKQNTCSILIGGEANGLAQLDAVIETLKITNEIEFLQLSPWISLGCLSPKTIYHKLKSIETRFNKSSITEIVIKLLRRDYFRFMGKKYGNKIFLRSGIQGEPLKFFENEHLMRQWTEARTGVLIVDAAINALRQTGHLNHPMRVLIGSYLIYELKQDWLVGAQFLESHLIDYDPCSNYGNWNRIAGVGATKQDDSKPNFEHQAKLLDPDGTFVSQWT